MMATISPALVEELKALHREAGLAYVAAPVLGVPAVEIVRGTMAEAVDQGLGAKDWSVLAKVTRRRAGLGEGTA